MVLTEEEKRRNNEKERRIREEKEREKQLLLKEIAEERGLRNEMRAPVPKAAPAGPTQKVTVRLIYDIQGKKGRMPVELPGAVETLSYFELLQRIADNFNVSPSQLILRLAKEGVFPLAPQDEVMPGFNSYSSIDSFPSLETLGLRSGQELFLTVTPAGDAAPAKLAGKSEEEGARPAPMPPASSSDEKPKPPATPSPSAPSQPQPPAPQPPKTSPQPKPEALPPLHNEGVRMKYMWRTVEQQRLAWYASRDRREQEEIEAVRSSQEGQRLAGLLSWSEGELKFYARLKADLGRTIGLEPVKEFIVQRLRDAAGRHILKEPKHVQRHVLISGHFGVGKRYAAELIGRLFALLMGNTAGGRLRQGARVRLAKHHDPQNRGALLTKSDVGVIREELPTGNPAPYKVQGPSGRTGNYAKEELVVEVQILVPLRALTDLLDPKTQEIVAPEGTCYYMRLQAGASLTDADGAILEGLFERGCVVILAGLQASMEATLQLAAFRKRQPDLIELPTLGPTELARLIANGVEQRGYIGVGEGDAGTPEIITVLEHIVRRRFDEALIREKNAHLAQDLLDLAVSRKNDRTWDLALSFEERCRLLPVDFGLDVLTADQRERRLCEVEAELEQRIIGWGEVEEPGTPRNFFATMRRQLDQAHGGAGKGGPSSSHFPKTLWVTGNAGVGKHTFVYLAARYLRACGATLREEVVLVDAAELIASGDSLLQGKLSTASRGCLAIHNAEVLADSRDALRTILAALEVAEASSTLVVIMGLPTGMARIFRMEPSLESRFPNRVQIPDFTAEELVQFMEDEAANLPSGALTCEDGLAARLVHHIKEMYGGGVGGKDLGEAGNLAIAQKLLQRAMQNRITRLFNRIQEGDHPGEIPESESLTAADFDIGAPLGEGEEEKAAIDEEVRNLIGMQKAKDWFAQVRQKVAFVEQTGTRSDLRVCLNIIITGNPGTGKTTFARLLAKFFYTYGVLTRESFVEKNGLELKAEFMGGTAPRVKGAVQEALGGCLFLDEAYALIDSNAGVGGHGDAFSQEAMRTLLTEVENHRTNLLVVLAGYKDKMGRLMRADEGLARRFPNRLHLDDYSPDELAAICEMVARQRHQRNFEEGLREKLARHIENFYWRDIPEQNAGLAVNLTEKALDRQIVRIVSKYPQAFSVPHARPVAQPQGPQLLRQKSGVGVQEAKQDATIFTAADFGIEERPTLGDPEMRAQVKAEVASLIGMANVKSFFEELSRCVAFVERGGDPKVLRTSLNLRLTGKPGTGKTTTARLIGRYLHAHGVLPRDAFIERNALMLKGQFVGQSAPTVVEAVRDAMGGCLFIDEAYALADRGGDKFSGEVVRTLLTEVENHRTGLLVVLAGYEDKMEQLMDADPGLRRRFSMKLQLEDYSPAELALICEKVAKERFLLSFASGLRDSLAKHISVVHGTEISQHNGGLAVTLVERAFRQLAVRLGGVGDDFIGGDAARELLPEDFGIQTKSEGTAAPHDHAACLAAMAMQTGGSRSSRETAVRPPPSKRGRADVKSLMASFAQELAAQLRGVADGSEPEGDEDNAGGVGSAGPSNEARSKAVAKVLARTKEREKQKEVDKEEEQMPQQEGERVIEEMSTLEALERIGNCPANFEWFEVDPVNPPDATCGICGYKLADGYRCGGGTHFVCIGCIDAYKTRDTSLD